MWDWISKLNELRNSGQLMVLVTVTKTEGSTPREIGAKMLVLANGSFFGTIGGGGVEKMALEEARKCLDEGISRTFEIALTEKNKMLCYGKMELYMDVIFNNPQVYIFGAGHVGQALSRVLAETPFVIHLVDEREEWIGSDRIPGTVNRHGKSFAQFIESTGWNGENTYVAIMTHSAEIDQEILSLVLKKPNYYLGLVGSENKWKKIRSNLVQAGFSEDELLKVRCPVGLKLGGKSPQEIAISIAAEILKTYYEKGNT